MIDPRDELLNVKIPELEDAIKSIDDRVRALESRVLSDDDLEVLYKEYLEKKKNKYYTGNGTNNI